MKREQIINSLVGATIAVIDFMEHKLTLDEFEGTYYGLYYDAIDGLETSDNNVAISAEIEQITKFNNKVQEIVSLIYTDDKNADIYQKAGRIDITEAIVRLESLVEESDIINIIKSFKNNYE